MKLRNGVDDGFGVANDLKFDFIGANVLLLEGVEGGLPAKVFFLSPNGVFLLMSLRADPGTDLPINAVAAVIRLVIKFGVGHFLLIQTYRRFHRRSIASNGGVLLTPGTQTFCYVAF